LRSPASPLQRAEKEKKKKKKEGRGGEGKRETASLNKKRRGRCYILCSTTYLISHKNKGGVWVSYYKAPTIRLKGKKGGEKGKRKEKEKKGKKRERMWVHKTLKRRLPGNALKLRPLIDNNKKKGGKKKAEGKAREELIEPYFEFSPQ